MGQHTNIQWADATINPTTGCDGCELWNPNRASCYAGGIHETRLAKTLPHLYGKSFHEVGLAPGRMKQAAAWSDLRGKDRPDKPWFNGWPRIIFVSDMSDAMSKEVPFDYLRDEVIKNVASQQGQRHIWMWLTKQPQRMLEFSQTLNQWPVNLWAGTSVTTQATLLRARHLLKVPAATHFLSVEPMWEGIDLDGPELLCADYPDKGTIGKYLDLVIVGGESGPHAKPMDLQWVYDLVGQCHTSNTAVFVKQLGAKPYLDAPDDHWNLLRDSHGGDWSDPNFPEDLKIREFPKVN